jgi:hypothetical protein
MKLKLEQFNIEIENPTIEINLKTIRDNAIDKLLSIDIVLVVDKARFGVNAENMPYVETWSDSDIEVMVVEWLKQFEI